MSHLESILIESDVCDLCLLFSSVLVCDSYNTSFRLCVAASLLFALSVSVHVSERYISAGLFRTYNIKLNLIHTRIPCSFSVAGLLQMKYSSYLYVQVTCVSSLVAWTAFWVSMITGQCTNGSRQP